MSEHLAVDKKKKKGSEFTYEKYDRTHKIRFEGGKEILGSSAPEFLGNAEYPNPEQMLAAALSACHMLTFLAIAAKSRLTVESYEDEAVATLGPGADKKLTVTKVVLRPRIRMSEVTAEKFASLHEKSHANCFIALAVKCEVLVEPELIFS